jgi:hypothetical protein
MSLKHHGKVGDKVICTMDGGHNMPIGQEGVIHDFMPNNNSWPHVDWTDGFGEAHRSCLRFEQYDVIGEDTQPDTVEENPNFSETKPSYDAVYSGAYMMSSSKPGRDSASIAPKRSHTKKKVVAPHEAS